MQLEAQILQYLIISYTLNSPVGKDIIRPLFYSIKEIYSSSAMHSMTDYDLSAKKKHIILSSF